MLPRGRGNDYSHRPYIRGRGHPPMRLNRGYYGGGPRLRPPDFRGRDSHYEKRGSGYYRISGGRLSPSQKRRRSSSRPGRRSISRSRSRSRGSQQSRSRSPYRRYSRSRSRSATARRHKSHSRSAERERDRSRSQNGPRENRSRSRSASSSSSSSSYSRKSSEQHLPKSAEPKLKLDNVAKVSAKFAKKLNKEGVQRSRSRSGSIDLSLRITVGNEKYLEQKSVLLPDVSKPPPPLANSYAGVPAVSHQKPTRHMPYGNAGADSFPNAHPTVYEPKQQPSNNSQLLEAEILKHISAMPSYLKDDMAKKEWLLSSLSGVLANRQGVPSGTSLEPKPTSIPVNYAQPPVADPAVLRQLSKSSNTTGYGHSLSTDVGHASNASIGVVAGNGASLTEMEDEDLYLYGDEGASQVVSGGSHQTPSNVGGYQGGRGSDDAQQQMPGTSQMAALVNDPTIGSILKSIGLSDPSALATGLQSQSLEQSIDQGSSFLSGVTPLPPVDFGKVFAKDDVDVSGKRKRRRVPDTYESYEERARKYREEQIAAMNATYQTVDDLHQQQTHDDYRRPLGGQYGGGYYDDACGGGDASVARSSQTSYSGLASIQQYDNVPQDEPPYRRSSNNDNDNQNSGNYTDYRHGNRDYRPPSFNEFDPVSRGETKGHPYSGVDRRLSQRDDYDRRSIEDPRSEQLLLDDRDRDQSKGGNRFGQAVDVRDGKPPSLSAKRVIRSARELDLLKREIDVNYNRLKLLDRELGRIRRDKSELLMRPKWDKLSLLEEGTVANLSREEQSLQREISALQSATEESESLLEASRAALLAEQEDEAKRAAEKKAAEATAIKKEKVSSANATDSSSTSAAKDKKIQLDFMDGGNHYCRVCCSVSENLETYCRHLHDKKHRKLVHPADRPWAPLLVKNPPAKPSGGKQLNVPFRGSEFVLGVRAFFCSLCREFSGDSDCALAHLKSKQHDEKYQQYITEYPVYEKNLALEKNARIAKAAAGESFEKPDSKNDRESSSDRSRDRKRSTKDADDKKKLIRQLDEDDRKRRTVGEPGTKEAGGGLLVWKGQTQKRICIDLNSSDSESESSTARADNNGRGKRSTGGAQSSSSSAKSPGNETKKKLYFPGGISAPLVSKSKWEQEEDGGGSKGSRSSTRFSADSKATRELATELLRKKAETKAQKGAAAPASVDMFQAEGGSTTEKSSASSTKPSTLFPIVSALDNGTRGKERRESSRSSGRKDKELKLLGLSKDDFDKANLKPTPPPQMAPAASKRPLVSLTASAAKDLYSVFYSQSKDGGDSDSEENSLARSIENAKRAAAELAAQIQSDIAQPYVSASMPTLADKQAAAQVSAPAKKTLKIAPKAPPTGVIIAPRKSLKMAAKVSKSVTATTNTKPVQASASTSAVVGGQPPSEQKDDDAKSDTSEINAGDFDIVDEL